MVTTSAVKSKDIDDDLSVRGLLEDLVADAMVTPEEAKRVYTNSRMKADSDKHPLVIIAELQPADARNPGKILLLEHFVAWLAKRIGMPYERIDPLKVDVRKVAHLISYAYAAKRHILPIQVSRDTVVIACADPFKVDWKDEISQLLRKHVLLVLSNPLDIARYLDEFYDIARSIKRATREGDESGRQIIQNLEQLIELGRLGQLDAEDHHVVHIVDWLLQYAFEQRASDIHLEPRRDQGEIRFRIDGVLHSVYQVPPNVMNAIIGRIKILGRMDIAEKRRPLDGRLKTKTPEGSEIELRLSTVPTALGEKMVLRIFDPAVMRRSFEDLGLSSQELNIWEGLVKQPHGIILVTGPTGSGKTTTLYSTLKQLATPDVNVCTIEDPIEMVEPAFNQIQAQPSIDLTFAAGVRALLRQDPDIIMIGEIRDLQTAEMAVQAALTGHLVFSTLHTNDAPSAITRLLEIGVPAYLINATVLGVVAQRLVRTLCPHCKTELPLEEDTWQGLVDPWDLLLPMTVYGPKGCLECRNTGYYGRIGLFEMVRMTPLLQKRVIASADLAAVREQALKDGMQPLRISGAKKISAGVTTLTEVMRVIPKENPEI